MKWCCLWRGHESSLLHCVVPRLLSYPALPRYFRVAVLVCHQLDVVALSLVGHDTSVRAALVTLWQREQLAFLLADGAERHGPLRLQRLPIGYKQFSTRIQQELGYREPVPLDEALRRMIAWEHTHPPAEIDPNLFDDAAEGSLLARLL